MIECKLGTSLSSLTDYMTDYGLIEALRNSGIRTFELNAQMFFYDYDNALRNEFKKMLAETGKRVISFHIPFYPEDDLSAADEKDRIRAVSRFRAHYAAVKEFGCEYIVVHPSAETVEHSKAGRDERIGQLRKSLLEIENDVKEMGVKVALEFLPRFCLGNSLNEIERILDGMHEEIFGVCFDVNHIMGQYPLIPEITRKLGKRLFTTHISDYDGIDECHWLPGNGIIDWKGFLDALEEIGYRGPFNYEILKQEGTFSRKVRMLEDNFEMLKRLQ